MVLAATIAAYVAVATLNAGIEHRVGLLGHLPLIALPSDLASLVMTPCFALLIATCAGLEADGAVLPVSREGLVRLGQWSFALYISHMTLVLLVQPAVPSSTGLEVRTLIGDGTLLAAIGVSGLLFRFVETPMQSLLRGRGRPTVAAV